MNDQNNSELPDKITVAPISQAEVPKPTNDSFNVPVKKSPWLIFGLLQIPLVIFMVIMLYVMYQARQN